MLYKSLEFNPAIEVAGIAEDGAQTIELVKATNPDVLLLDIVIPRISGLDVLRELNKMQGVKPIVFVISALGSDDVTREALSLGVSFYFIKPFDIKVLESKILAAVKEKSDM